MCALSHTVHRRRPKSSPRRRWAMCRRSSGNSSRQGGGLAAPTQAALPGASARHRGERPRVAGPPRSQPRAEVDSPNYSMASPPRHLGGRDPLPLLSPRQQDAESGETGTTSFGTSGQCSPSHARSPTAAVGHRASAAAAASVEPPTSRDVVPPLRTAHSSAHALAAQLVGRREPAGQAGAPSGASPTAPTAPWPTPACTRTSPLAPTPPAHAPPHGSPHGARHAQAVIASQNLSPRFARGGGAAVRVEQQPANLARRGKT